MFVWYMDVVHVCACLCVSMCVCVACTLSQHVDISIIIARFIHLLIYYCVSLYFLLLIYVVILL